MFNPFSDHERYAEKKPSDMSIPELQMLLKIKRQNLELGWLQFQSDLQFWQRIGKAVQKSGLLELWKEKLYPNSPNSDEQETETNTSSKED